MPTLVPCAAILALLRERLHLWAEHAPAVAELGNLHASDAAVDAATGELHLSRRVPVSAGAREAMTAAWQRWRCSAEVLGDSPDSLLRTMANTDSSFTGDVLLNWESVHGALHMRLASGRFALAALCDTTDSDTVRARLATTQLVWSAKSQSHRLLFWYVSQFPFVNLSRKILNTMSASEQQAVAAGILDVVTRLKVEAGSGAKSSGMLDTVHLGQFWMRRPEHDRDSHMILVADYLGVLYMDTRDAEALVRTD